MRTFEIQKGMTHPKRRPLIHRTSLDDLIHVAKNMECGDCVALKEANTMRIILNTLGFDCVTDGWNCPDRTKVYVFKLQKELAT